MSRNFSLGVEKGNSDSTNMDLKITTIYNEYDSKLSAWLRTDVQTRAKEQTNEDSTTSTLRQSHANTRYFGNKP